MRGFADARSISGGSHQLTNSLCKARRLPDSRFPGAWSLNYASGPRNPPDQKYRQAEIQNVQVLGPAKPGAAR